TPFKLEHVFPEVSKLSKELDRDGFLMHHFTQPLLFIRVRRGKQSIVDKVLKNAGIEFEVLSPNVLAVDNGVSLDQLPELRGLIEVQDLSSQRTTDGVEIDSGDYVWGACAGGGGKSLALLDKFKGIRLFASDLRPHSLRNLENRARAAGFNKVETMVLDL